MTGRNPVRRGSKNVASPSSRGNERSTRQRTSGSSSSAPDAPPTSRPEAQPASAASIQFISSEAEMLYHTKFGDNVTTAEGKQVDLASFNHLYFQLETWFKFQKWDKLVSSEWRVYPRVVREFYANMTKHPSHLESQVKGVRIELSPRTLGAALGIPCEGRYEHSQNTWPDDLPGTTALSNILCREINSIHFQLTPNLLDLQMRFLHLIVAHILFPRSGSFTYFTIFDSVIMHYIKRMVRLDLPSMMVTHMHTNPQHPSRTVLPYGMYLTRIFEHFNINLSGEQSHKIHLTHHYSIDSVARMKWLYNTAREAYYKSIGGRTVWVYTRLTPAQLLPEGYSGPTGVPPNADPVEGEDDVPPPSDDPHSADPGASTSRPGRGRPRRASTASAATTSPGVEASIQQILASLSDLHQKVDRLTTFCLDRDSHDADADADADTAPPD